MKLPTLRKIYVGIFPTRIWIERHLTVNEQSHLENPKNFKDQGWLMSVRRRSSGLKASMSYAHQANIERYEKLLKTELTDLERDFIQRRLEEEKQSLTQLSMSDVA